jgi:hypothetical protein
MALATINVAEHLLGALKEAPYDPGRGVNGPHEDEQGDGGKREGVHHIERRAGKIVQGLVHEEQHPQAGDDTHGRCDLDARRHQQGQAAQERQGLEFEGHVFTPPCSFPPAA